MSNQIYILIAFFITGICIGILFDIFRVTRKSFKTPNILIYIEDILFWILTGFLLLFTIFTFTTGEIRLYMIVIMILGSFIYFMTISRLFMLVNSRILNFIKSSIIFLLTPLKKLNNFIKMKKNTKK